MPILLSEEPAIVPDSADGRMFSQLEYQSWKNIQEKAETVDKGEHYKPKKGCIISLSYKWSGLMILWILTLHICPF